MNNNAATMRTANSEQANSALVSIIIPAYNTAKYIHRAIESSLRQTHKNVEVLVIDDGSSDETLSVARNYEAQDSRVRVFTQKNAGVSAARNLGIREAGGEYMMFLDSDDWLEDNAVEILLEAQKEHPDRLIAADFFVVDTEGRRKRLNESQTQPLLLGVEDIAARYCHIIKSELGMHSSVAKIYASGIIKSGIEFPEGISIAEDGVFVIKYLHRVSGAFYVNKPVYNNYLRIDSATRSGYSFTKTQALIDAYDIMINLPENTPELKELLTLSKTLRVSWAVRRLLKLDTSGDYKAEIAHVRKYLRPYAGKFLRNKKLSFKIKRGFLFDMYAPVQLGRIVMLLWQVVKKILRRK